MRVMYLSSKVKKTKPDRLVHPIGLETGRSNGSEIVLIHLDHLTGENR